MKKGLIFGLIGFIIGVLITGIVMYNMAPGLMMMEDESSYNFEETITKFEESVKAHGWKIPTVHDLQKTMNKFGKDVKAVKVFELCHPDHAGKILAKSDERIVSSLMPCRVAFYEKEDGKVYMSRMNSGLMASMMTGIIPEVMDEAAKDTEEILKAVLPKI
ncbi:MAG: DUF302 domain-containing protein [Acidobacteriota bacterium]